MPYCIDERGFTHLREPESPFGATNVSRTGRTMIWSQMSENEWRG